MASTTEGEVLSDDAAFAKAQGLDADEDADQEAVGQQQDQGTEDIGDVQTEESDDRVPYDELQNRYDDLKTRIGQQGNELGELRRQLQAQQTQRAPQQEVDYWQSNPMLKNLEPAQRDLLAASVEATLRQMGVDTGQLPQQLQTLQNQVQQQQQFTQEQVLRQEVRELRQQIGEESWKKYYPKMDAYLQSNPNFGGSYGDLFKLVAFDDYSKGVSDRVQQNKQERAKRAAAADTGRTSSQTSRTTSNEVLEGIMDTRVSPRDALRKLVAEEGFASS